MSEIFNFVSAIVIFHPSIKFFDQIIIIKTKHFAFSFALRLAWTTYPTAIKQKSVIGLVFLEQIWHYYFPVDFVTNFVNATKIQEEVLGLQKIKNFARLCFPHAPETSSRVHIAN
eukprot:GHVP01038588.1.p1 GENE.GHVP01038588.1~~GHVP01038588.1.p1  ORF type:complete len:115 (+),score=6.25 GHVP01038588.1:376-720(+)